MKRGIVLLWVMLCWPGIRTDAQEVRRVKITELEKLMNESKYPLLINFWATWCKPCVEEMPSLIQEVKNHEADSLQLILVSLDDKENYPVKLQDFIRDRNYKGTFLWLDETNADYFCPRIDTAWSGAIPASLFIHRKYGYRRFVESKLSDKALMEILKEMFFLPTRDE